MAQPRGRYFARCCCRFPRTDSGGGVIPSFIAAITEVLRSPRCYCAMWTAIRWPWVWQYLNPQTICGATLPPPPSFRYSYHRVLLAQRWLVNGLTAGVRKVKSYRSTRPATGNATALNLCYPHLWFILALRALFLCYFVRCYDYFLFVAPSLQLYLPSENRQIKQN